MANIPDVIDSGFVLFKKLPSGLPTDLSLDSLSEVETVWFETCELDDAGVAVLLSACPMLKELRVEHCSEVCGAFAASMPEPTKLKSIELSRLSLFRIESFRPGLGWKALERIAIHSCSKIDDNELSLIAKHGAVQSVALSECTGLSSTGVQELWLMRTLKEVRLDANIRLSIKALAGIAESNIEVLALTNCDWVDNKALFVVASATKIIDLELAYGFSYVERNPSTMCFNAEGISALGALKLQRLDLSYRPDINETTMRAIGKHLPTLKCLRLDGCKIEHARSIKALLDALDGVEEIGLSNIEGLDKTILPVLGQHSALKTVDVRGTSITESDVEDLIGSESTMEILVTK
ncbi:MAG: hypothetical protein R3E76_16310 [Planctomycetota bacterium]